MKIRAIFIAALLSMTASLSVFASDKKAGTSAAPFLKIGAGARPTAMGNAFTGISDDANAVHFNPAGISYISRPEMTAMHTQYFEDMSYDFGSFVYPTDFGAFAISAATLKVEDLQRRGTDESYKGNFDSMDAAYGLSYARNLGPLLSLGITTRYLSQELDSHKAGTWMGDIGLLKRLGRYPISIGIAAKNFGPEVEFRNTSDPLPFTINTGIGANLFKDRLILGLDINAPRDSDIQFGSGAEWNIRTTKDMKLALRGGYNTTGTDGTDRSGFTMGGGVGFQRFELDFAFVPMGNLGNTYRYSARVRF